MREYTPFAITARCIGKPSKLFTPVAILNLQDENSLAGAVVNAMWDTGAEICLMSRRLADMLGVRFRETTEGAGVFGRGLAPVGYAYVSIAGNGDCIETLAAIVDETSPSDDYSFIIGMDFIRKGALAITTITPGTFLSFRIPPGDPVDFVADADERSATEYLPLSASKEELRPVYGPAALELILPKKQPRRAPNWYTGTDGH